MIRLLSVAVVSGLVAQPVLALSCVAPTVARSTQQAIDADETYRIVNGRFSFDSSVAPFAGQALPDGETATVPARFEGTTLTASGFTEELSVDVSLNVECLMQSCGSLMSRTETLAFLRVADGVANLDLGPCPGWTFPNPTEAQLRTVIDCVSGNCPAD